jgi:integrase
MPIYKRGDKWLVSVGSGTDRFRATLSTRQEAIQVEEQELFKRKREQLAERFGDAVMGKPEKASSGITMGKLYDMAFADKWKGSKGERVAVMNAKACLDSLGWDTPVENITMESIRNMARSFVVSDGNSGSTVNRKLSSLSVMLSIAEDEGWLDRHFKMPRKKEAEHRIRYMSAEEEIAAIQFAKHNGFNGLADLIPFAIDTGFRKAELEGLTHDDCRNARATLHAGATKSDKARSVPLTQRCQEIVQKRYTGNGKERLFKDLTVATLRTQWDLLRAHMGMTEDKNFTLHMLRHTCASRLAMAGKSAVFIKDWLGHSSIMVTQRYMHLSPTTLMEGVDALDNYRKPELKVVGG